MKFVGADHAFHDDSYVKEWAERFRLSPARQQLFEDIVKLLKARVRDKALVVELGTGPGFLAEFVLENCPEIEYVGIDFSREMFELAGKRIKRFNGRFSFRQMDLTQDAFLDHIEAPVDAIISTWSLHDLGSQVAIKNVYRNCREILNGMLINGDFIDPVIPEVTYEPGRIPVAQHLKMLEELEYAEVRCEGLYELNREHPTPVNNYACIVGFNTNPSKL